MEDRLSCVGAVSSGQPAGRRGSLSLGKVCSSGGKARKIWSHSGLEYERVR